MSGLYSLYRYLIDGTHRNFVDSYRSKSVAPNKASTEAPGADPVEEPLARPIKLALGHKSRVGKDTAADAITETYGGHIIRFAEPVYEAAARYLLSLTGNAYKMPELLQLTGGLMRLSNNMPVRIAERKLGEIERYGVFLRHNWGVYTPLAAVVKAGYNKCTGKYIGRNTIVVDMRYTDEMEMLVRNDFETVRITRADYDKVVDRDTRHVSEWALDRSIFRHDWENTGTIDKFKADVKARCRDIFATKK